MKILDLSVRKRLPDKRRTAYGQPPDRFTKKAGQRLELGGVPPA